MEGPKLDDMNTDQSDAIIYLVGAMGRSCFTVFETHCLTQAASRLVVHTLKKKLYDTAFAACKFPKVFAPPASADCEPAIS